jgi:hypothetical protein
MIDVLGLISAYSAHGGGTVGMATSLTMRIHVPSLFPRLPAERRDTQQVLLAGIAGGRWGPET